MNVEITPFEERHAQVSWRLRNNERLWTYMESDAPLPATLESELAYAKALANDHKKQVFAILVDGSFVGYISLKNIAYGAAELSYCVMREDLWGRGIVSKATSLMLSHAYEDLRLELVYIYIDRDNKASYANMVNKHFARVGMSFIKKNVERLEMTRTGWERALK